MSLCLFVSVFVCLCVCVFGLQFVSQGLEHLACVTPSSASGGTVEGTLFTLGCQETERMPLFSGSPEFDTLYGCGSKLQCRRFQCTSFFPFTGNSFLESDPRRAGVPALGACQAAAGRPLAGGDQSQEHYQYH